MSEILFSIYKVMKTYILKSPIIVPLIIFLMPAILGYALTMILNFSIVNVSSGLIGQLISTSNNRMLLSNIFASSILISPIYFVLFLSTIKPAPRNNGKLKLVLLNILSIAMLIGVCLLMKYGLPGHALINPRKVVLIMVLSAKTSITFSFFVSVLWMVISFLVCGIFIFTKDLFKSS